MINVIANLTSKFQFKYFWKYNHISSNMILSRSSKGLQSICKIAHYMKFSTSPSVTKEKWDLLAAVCVERKPVIVPELNKIEKEFKNYLADLELSNSLKNDMEIRNEAEIKQEELIKAGEADIDSDVTLKQTVQDFIDASIDEASKFKLASRITDDDTKNNTKSLNRKLDKNLVLLVNEKIGEDSFYILPQAKWQAGETLRQTAERVLKDTCGDSIKTQIQSNAPAGFYKYKYPKEIREKGIQGAKVFIYFARYQQGHITNENLQYKWLDRNELYKTVPVKYSKSLQDMLIDE